MLDPIIAALLWLFDTVVWLYVVIIIAAVVVSWLVAFGVLNTYNPMARGFIRVLDSLTEPVFRQIRRVIPPIGGLDLSPMLVLLGLYFLRIVVDGYAMRAGYAS